MHQEFRSHINSVVSVCSGKKIASSNNSWGRTFHVVSLIGVLLLLGPISTISSQQNISEEEYRVYSDYLNGLTKKELGKLIPIDDHTWCPDYDGPGWNEVSAKLHSKFVRLSQETLDNFFLKNRDEQNLLLNSRFNIKVRYLLLRDPVNKVREDYIKGEDGWKNFYREHSGAKGLITFSRVGFNQNLDEALVHLVVQSGLSSGSSFFALLRKQRGVWRVISTLTTGQS